MYIELYRKRRWWWLSKQLKLISFSLFFYDRPHQVVDHEGFFYSHALYDFWKILSNIHVKWFEINIHFLNCRPHQIFDHDGFTSSLDAWHFFQKWKRGSIPWNNPTQSLHQSLPNWRYPLQYQVCERINNWMR